MILHIFNDPKFSRGYFEFLIKHGVNLNNHALFHFRCRSETGESYGMQAIFSPGFFSLLPNLRMLRQLFASEKIIIHSLASPFLLLYLFVFPHLCKKCYWAIWGKDLYFYKTLVRPRLHHKVYEFFRRKVIRKIPNIIGFSERDIDYARKWYGSEAIVHHSFSYPSNCYRGIAVDLKPQEVTKNILLGNSADPTNDHFSAFPKIAEHLPDITQIIIPLSYGDRKYAAAVKNKAQNVFGDRLRVLDELLDFETYLQLLSKIDIAVFPNSRQQAMGTIITLLGMRKKVYIRRDITTWGTLSDLGIVIYDIDQFNLSPPPEKILKNNEKIVKEVFSERALLEQWLCIFNH